MADINIGDMLYDSEAEGNIIGWVTGVNPNYHCNVMVTWNDGATIMMHQDIVRDLKKEWYKLRRKCLTKKRK
jgi:hypothetical protein